MQSRRDQVEAQTYLLSRLTGALVSAEPDAPEPPTRRDSRGIIAGAMVALLAVGVVAAFALFFAKGSTAWRQPGTLILDKSSGSRFLLVDGKLRPVLNLASAKLLIGANVRTKSVKTAALKDVPRADPIGIPGAPDSLPQPALLNSGVWRVCATTPQTGLTMFPSVRLVSDIGDGPSGRRLGPEQGVLVVSRGQSYLVWQGKALRLARPWVADVLGWGGVSPIPVSPDWLNLLERGPELGPVQVQGRGAAGPQIDGRLTKVGQVFHVDAAGVQSPHYILLKSGLSALSATEFLLASADTKRFRAVSISAGALAEASMANDHGDTRGLPITPPTAVRAQAGLTPCLEYPGLLDHKQSEVVWAALPPAAAPAGAAGSAIRPPKALSESSASGTGLSGRHLSAAPAAADDQGPSVGSSGVESLGSTSDSSVGGGLGSTGRARAVSDNAIGPSADGARAVQVRPGAGVLIRVPQGSGADNDSLLLVNDSGTVFPLAGKDEVTALGYTTEAAITVPGRFVQLLPGGALLSISAAQ